MDLKVVGQRIKTIREEKNLSQEDLAELVNLSTNHISVIERGIKIMRLDTFVAIANVLEVSADELLVGFVDKSVIGVSNALNSKLVDLQKENQIKILNAISALLE